MREVTLYSTNSLIRSAVRTIFEGVQNRLVEVTDGAKPPRVGIEEHRQDTIGRLNLPDAVDAVVSCANLNSRTEGLAASLALKQRRNDVFAVVLPEGADFLRSKLDRQGSLVLVGADQAK